MKIFLYIGVSITSLYILVCAALALFQEKLLFFPEKLPSDYVYQFSRTFDEQNFSFDEQEFSMEERNFSMKDAVINSLFFKVRHLNKNDNRDPGGIIFYLHGNAGSLRRWGEVSYQFIALGYDILMIDYRGYGKSTGKISEKALFSDALSIYDVLASEYGENKITIYGRSIGSGIAAYVTSKRTPARLIMESPMYSMKDLVRHRYPIIPDFILRYPFRTDKYIVNVTCPVYIFHGTSDVVIYYGSSVKLANHMVTTCKLFTIKGGGHNDLVNFIGYNKNLRKILGKEYQQ